MQTDKTTTAPDFIPDFNRPEGFNITKTNKAEYMGEQYGWSSNERRWFKLTTKTTTESKRPVLIGFDRYPEFKPLVNEIVANVCNKINARATNIESEMPYRRQFTLEMVIERLQKLV